MKRKALIISIKGTELSQVEKKLFSRHRPWGVILFRRNLRSIYQIKKLTSEIKKLSGSRKFPILIDEEGRSVSRLVNVINHDLSANNFGKLYKKNKVFCLKIYKHYIYSLSKILNFLNINVNTIPVLDVLRLETNKVIGCRSFSKDKKIVKELGKYTLSYLHRNKISGIIKHLPGHGPATSDSHKKTPRVSMSLKKLENIDFYPFKLSKAKLAMTAHILYTKIDKTYKNYEDCNFKNWY